MATIDGGLAQLSGPALILVRHGETVGQSSIRYYGRTDVALSEQGREQMRAVARLLSSLSFGTAFASPLSRAREGARLILNRRMLDVVTIAEFVEIDFGDFEGLTADEIRLRLPAAHDRWLRSRLEDSYRYPGGESRASFNTRVARGLDRMLALWRPSDPSGVAPALLIAHRGVVRALLRRLVGLEPEIALASVHAVKLEGSRWRPLAMDITAN